MQKNTTTVKRAKNASRNALQVIIQGLSLSDSDKLKLHEDLRNMGITDDNDPVIKLTMVEGLFAQYTGERVEKLVKTSEHLEDTMLANENIADRFSNDLRKFQENIKVWNNKVIIGTQEMIAGLRYEEKSLQAKNREEQEKLDKAKEKLNDLKKEHDDIVTRGFAINVVSAFVWVFIFLIFLGVTYVHGYEKLEKEVIKRRELIKEYNVTPKLTRCDGKAYVLVRRDDIVDFTDGTTGAELDTWSVVDDIW